MKNILKSGIFATALLVSSVAPANQANYQHYLVGDRAAGMGGGICAMANNIDAMYYNPAGLTRASRNSLSLSANLYGWQLYRADDTFYPEEDFGTDSFQSIPTTVGVVLRAETNWVVGFAALVPEKSSYFETATYPKHKHYYNMSSENQTLWIGPSAACQINPKLSLGGSVFVVYHGYNSMVSLYWDDQDTAYSRSLKFNDFEMLALLGLQYKLTDRWNLGLAVQTPTASVQSDGEWLEQMAVDEDGDFAGYVRHATDLEAEKIQPALIRAGIAWENPKVMAWGFDLTYHFPTSGSELSGTDDEGEPLDISLSRTWVLDVNMGGEYYLWKTYPLRVGFFTSQSSSPGVDLSKDAQSGALDLYGFTCTGGVETKNTTMNLGINYLFGSGEDYGWKTDPDKGVIPCIVNATENHLYFIFNTSYFF
ncbi:MAG: hypothetical protein V2A34_08670 [Lentisphaerota bacterium]